jgi:excinuclease UvrABC helicase subunit UvrB
MAEIKQVQINQENNGRKHKKGSTRKGQTNQLRQVQQTAQKEDLVLQKRKTLLRQIMLAGVYKDRGGAGAVLTHGTDIARTSLLGHVR